MDLSKKYKLTNNLIKNVEYMHQYFGPEFDILYKGEAVPVKLVYSEFFTRNKCWQLVYNGEVLKSELHVFKILFYPDNFANIYHIRSCDRFRGSEVVMMVLEICKFLKAKIATVEDRAHILCKYSNIYLSILKLISEGRTFYGKYGFIPYVKPGLHGYTKSEEVQEDISKYLGEFKLFKTSEVIGLLQKIVDKLYRYKGRVIAKQLYAGDPTFLEDDYYHVDLDDQKKGKIIKEYKNIISKAGSSNKEYFYEHMLDEAKDDCMHYMAIEHNLYKNHQIYSFVFGPEEISRDFIVPIIKVIYLHNLFNYYKDLSK